MRRAPPKDVGTSNVNQLTVPPQHQFLQSGDVTTLRFLFAFFGDFKSYRDVSPIELLYRRQPIVKVYFRDHQQGWDTGNLHSGLGR